MIANQDKTALIFKGQHISYPLLHKNIATTAQQTSDYTQGRIAIFSENRPEWIYAFYAALKNKNSVVPIDFMAAADEVAYIINDCRPHLIYVSEDKRPVMEKALQKVNYDPGVIPLDTLHSEAASESSSDFSALEFETDPDETALLIYTSGTTGSPKGVMLSFRNILFNIEAVSKKVPIYHEDQRVLMLLPLHHIFPLLGTLVAPLYVGSAIAIAPSLNAEDIKETLQKNSVTMMVGVPRLYRSIWEGIERKINARLITRFIFSVSKRISSRTVARRIFRKVHEQFGNHLNYLVSGGAALDGSVARAFRTLGFEVLEGYGMTETAPMITFPRPGEVKIGSVGQAVEGVSMRFEDGEICVQGPNVMQGYYNRPEETAEILRNGWLRTGDIGHLDNGGYLYITGRRKEIIILPNGKNVNPVEIEETIEQSSELIAETGVFLQDEQLYCVIYPDFTAVRRQSILNLHDHLRSEVIARYNQHASPYKRIMQFTITQEPLPRTRMGKLQRFKLAERVKKPDISAESLQEPKYKEYHIIKDYLLDQTTRPVYPEAHLEFDLALDSLDKVSFLTFIQNTFGLNLAEDTLIDYSTVEKIAQYVRERRSHISVEAVRWTEILKERIEVALPKSWFTLPWLKRFFRIFFRLYFRVKSSGISNLPNPPFILAANHQSFFDGLFVTMDLKKETLKNTYFYAKEKHVRKGWIKYIAHRHNVIVMDLNRDLKLSLQKLAEVLKRGKNVIIFPEGTRSRDGQLGKFKKTFAILSRELNVPVVPVRIQGAYEALPSGGLLPRPWKKIRVHFLEPVYPQNLSYENIRARVYEMLGSDFATGGREQSV